MGAGGWLQAAGHCCSVQVRNAQLPQINRGGVFTSLSNEEEVGKAIRESGIPREELYVVTKVVASHNMQSS